MAIARKFGKKRRVTILQPYIAQYRSKFIQNLIRIAEENNIDLEILAGLPNGDQAKRNDNYSVEGVTKLRQFEINLFGRRLTFRLIPLRVFSSDLIIWEQARRNIDAYCLLVPRRLRPFRGALWGHGADYMGSSSRIDEWLRRLLTKNADWFFSYTERGKESVIRQGLSEEKVTVVYNSTDTALLRSQISNLTQEEIQKFRNKLKLSEKNTILFMGGIDFNKRIDIVLNVTKMVKQTIPDLTLLICGDGAERSLVQQASAAHEWIKYLGPTFGDQKTMALAASNVILNPGLVGLIAVDSLASGTPIVTSADATHAPEFEYLVDGETCIVTSGTAHDLSEAIQSLLTDTQKLAEMGKNCSKSVSNLSAEKMAQNFFDGISLSLVRNDSV